MKALTPDTVNTIGLWLMRLALVIGAIVLAYHGKDELASTCAFVCIVSFFLL